MTVSIHNVEFIKQIKDKMSESNIKTRLSSGFLIARKLTKRQRLHLLTVSQRECKEITKTGFYFGLGSFLRFPLHSAHDSCSVTDVICLFHLVTERGGSTLYSPCPQRLDLIQNTHLCFFQDYKSAFVRLAVLKIIASF